MDDRSTDGEGSGAAMCEDRESTDDESDVSELELWKRGAVDEAEACC